MLAAMSLLILEIQQDGIDTLRLLTDRVNHLLVERESALKVHIVIEIACTGESVLQIALQNLLTSSHEVLLAMLLAILDGIEGIEQYAAHETDLCLGVRLTVAGEQCMTRMVLQGEVAYIRLTEIVGQTFLHLLRRETCFQGLRIQTIEAALPHHGDVLAKILGLALTDAPFQGLGFAFLYLSESKDRSCQGELTNIAFGCLDVRIAEGELGLLLIAVQTQIAQRGLATQDDLPLLMGGQALLWTIDTTHDGHRLTVSHVEDTGHGRRQTVLAEVPALGSVEGWCAFRRTQVAMIPEAWQIELAVGRLDASGKRCTYIIIGGSIGFDGDGVNLIIAIVNALFAYLQRQCTTIGSFKHAALRLQLDDCSRIAWLLDTDLRFDINCRCGH